MRNRAPTAAEFQQAKDRVRLRLAREFPFYAQNILKIRTKPGEVLPLRLNRAQLFLHNAIEKQLHDTGRVRAAIVKGRQTGASTYIAGRAYWKVTHNRGNQAFVLTHEEAATQNLFTMTNRYHEYCPPEFRPTAGAANAKELIFSDLDSGFKVGTAGNKGAGRSSTLQFFHGSEVAFWPNAGEHMAGVMQAIADVPGSEAYLESTANGIGNVFHTLWTQAERGEIDYIPIFLPWFWSDEYSRPLPAGNAFDPSGDWMEYQEVFHLTDEQLFWAYRKNGELLTEQGTGGDPDKISPKFKQEYPGTAAQAFETSGADAFIDPLKVLKARKASVTGYGPIILGVDPARGGKDKTSIIDRQGRRLGGHVCRKVNYGENTMAIAQAVKADVARLLPLGLVKVCIDTTGLGGPIYDRLTEIIPDSENLLEPVNFGENAHEPDRFLNRRSEMWDRQRVWFNDPAGVQVPDLDELQGDMCAPIVGSGATHWRSNGQLVLEPKDKIKHRIGISPDYGDAGALTHAPDMATIFAEKRSKRDRSSRSYASESSSWGA